jgi:hypothetical protein
MHRTLLAWVIPLTFMISAAQAADSLQLTCSGDMIEPAGLARTPKSLSATLTPANKATKVSVDLGLKFRTKDFTGEYFHYAGDMFLIYKSGHLARLSCKPNG